MHATMILPNLNVSRSLLMTRISRKPTRTKRTAQMQSELPTSTLFKALSGRLDGICPDLAPGICDLYESIRTAKDRILLQRFTEVCDKVLPALVMNPAYLPALVQCRLTPVNLRFVGVSQFALLDGILDLVDYRMDRSDKLLLLEYVLAGDQLWRRGFQK